MNCSATLNGTWKFRQRLLAWEQSAVGTIVGEGRSGNSAGWAWDCSTGLKDVIEALSAIGLESNITTMPRGSLRRPIRKV